MKYLAKSLKHFGLYAALYTGLDRAELEKLEYARPDDKDLKSALAQAYWCEGDRGLAIEKWKSFGATEFLSLSQKKDWKSIDKNLTCPAKN